MLEEIKDGEELVGLIIRSNFSDSASCFFTPDHFGQQLAYMRRQKGEVIAPHVHNQVERNIQGTQEILVIRSGSLRVDFFSRKKTYLESRILGKGDLVFLSGGGHGFEILEELEMINIKQGPYAGEEDKNRFQPLAPGEIRVTVP